MRRLLGQTTTPRVDEKTMVARGGHCGIALCYVRSSSTAGRSSK